MNTWITSDLHFWHANIIKFCNRPFATVEEMNEVLISNWNAVVQPEDTVYVVGDFSMAFRPVELYTKRLNGKKILVAGNHDFCHPGHKKGKNEDNRKIWTQKYIDQGFAEIHIVTELQIPGVANFKVCHLPYVDAAQDDTWDGGKIRYESHRLKDEGQPLLCGHVHEKWSARYTSNGTIMINVGVDSPGMPWHMRPASLKEISDYYLMLSTQAI